MATARFRHLGNPLQQPACGSVEADAAPEPPGPLGADPVAGEVAVAPVDGVVFPVERLRPV